MCASALLYLIGMPRLSRRGLSPIQLTSLVQHGTTEITQETTGEKPIATWRGF
jgi:hypothetical protein